MKVAILAPVHVTGLLGHLSLRESSGSLPSGMGGYCINTLIDERLRRGWKTDVITLDPNVADDITRMEGPLLRLWVVRRRKSGAVRDLFADERRLLMVAVAEAAPDLLHANWTYEYGLTAVRQSRYPYVLTVHDNARHCLRWLGWRYGVFYLITRYVLYRSRHLTAVSPYVGGYLEKMLGRPVPVIPNLVPRAAWEFGQEGGRLFPVSRTSGATVCVVSALNWSQLKNTRGALRAFRIARELCVEQGIDLKYTLMGSGLGSGGQAESWARRNGCAQGVTFKGVLAHEEALREIVGADILFHPSHEESYGCPVSEAMAMMVPVVACQEAGGSQWLCGDGRGFLCDGYDPQNMAERIVEACFSLDHGRCNAARIWLAELASEDKVLDALERVYASACGVEHDPIRKGWLGPDGATD